VVGRLMGAPEATATMSRDHAAFGRLVEELGALQAQMDGASLRETQERPCAACSMVFMPSSKSTLRKKRRSTSPFSMPA
jgi:3'-phosphoadenosine 5'-phosphosulfate (PAPS) 3'-phosphatase